MLERYDTTYPVSNFISNIRKQFGITVVKQENKTEPQKEPAFATDNTFKFGSVKVNVDGETSTVEVSIDYDHFGFPPDKVLPYLEKYTFNMDNLMFYTNVPTNQVQEQIRNLKKVLD